MKYYLIFLKNGKVVDISSFDEEDSRDRTATKYASSLTSFEFSAYADGSFDEIQTLNIVN